MDDKGGEEGVKNLKEWVTSFMDSPKPDLVNFKKSALFSHCIVIKFYLSVNPYAWMLRAPQTCPTMRDPKNQKKVTQVMTQKNFIKGMMGACFINQLRT